LTIKQYLIWRKNFGLLIMMFEIVDASSCGRLVV